MNNTSQDKPKNTNNQNNPYYEGHMGLIANPTMHLMVFFNTKFAKKNNGGFRTSLTKDNVYNNRNYNNNPFVTKVSSSITGSILVKYNDYDNNIRTSYSMTEDELHNFIDILKEGYRWLSAPEYTDLYIPSTNGNPASCTDINREFPNLSKIVTWIRKPGGSMYGASTIGFKPSIQKDRWTNDLFYPALSVHIGDVNCGTITKGAVASLIRQLMQVNFYTYAQIGYQSAIQYAMYKKLLTI